MYFKHVIKFLPFYSPDDGGGDGIGNVSSPDDADILESDDKGGDEGDEDKDQQDDEADETDEDKEDKDQNKEDEENDDEDDTEGDEEETDDEEEEQEEDGSTERLSTYTDIKKEYPDFFKKFPDIKAAIFRDNKYGEMFGSIKEAEEAARYSQVYQNMSDDILGKGEITELLDQVGKQKPESLEKIAFSILPYLFEKHKDLHFEVVAPVLKSLVRNVVREAGDKKDQVNLKNAALHLHNYIFGNTNIDEKMKAETLSSKKGTEKSKREEELEKALNERDSRDHTNFLNDVDSRYVRSVGKIVEAALEKDDRLTPWTKNKITDQLIKDVKKQMDGDKRFTTSMTNLLSQARKAGYTGDFKSRILTAALDRAKPLIPDIRRKLVAEALSKKLKAKDGKEEVTPKDDKGKFKPKKATNGSGKTIAPGYKKSSNPDLDILRS